MPEGDSIARVAARLAPLVGAPLEVRTPHARHALDRIPERLAGAVIAAVEPRGKHLLVRFSNGLVLHSHLRMTGRWQVGRPGQRWSRPAFRAWLVLATAEHEAVLFDGPVLELLTPAQAALHPALARLGGDVLDGGFDAALAARRARTGDPQRPVADVLLDQGVLAGVGNVWKSEALFACRIRPGRPLGEVADAELVALFAEVAGAMRAHVGSGAARRPARVYGRAGRPCPACGGPLVGELLGDEARSTFWCPRCQR